MHVRHKLILFTLLCIITRVGCSQPWYFNEIYNPNKTWASGLSIVGTLEGYFGCSISSDSITGYYNTCTFLLNPMGELVSWKNFGLSGFNFFPGYYGSLIKASENCFALFGSTRNLSSGLSNGLFYKFNILGDTLFTKSFFSEIYNMLVGRACANTIDGGYSLLGEVSVGANYSDLILIKTDDEANEIWRSQHGTAVDDWGVSVIQTTDSGFALGAWAYTPGQVESGDPIVIKTDSLGNFEWSLNFGGPYKDDKAMVCNTSDSCIMVLTAYADSMYTPEHAYTRINLVKVDLEGNVIWNKKYGPSKPVNYISNLIQIANGDYVLCGYSKVGYLPAAGWIMETNSEGDSLWYRDYHYFPEDPKFGLNYLYDISLAADHGFVATGQAYTLSPPNNVQKMWVLKVDSVGCEIENCWVGIEEEHGGMEVWGQGALEVWPNPAREVLNFKVSGLSSGRNYSLCIYDIFGRPAPTLIHLPADGEGSGWTIDISTLPPGIYIAVLRDGQMIKASKKFVVVG
jgi:hypothetical protein